MRLPVPAATLAALLAIAAAPVATAASSPSSYVALGDSYSAGTGTRSKVDDCYRSQEAFPAIISRQTGVPLDYQACSGARIPDVQQQQLAALGSSTTHVSISVGGNDAGFSASLTECAKPGWMSNCPASLDAAERTIASTIPTQLDTLYAQISAKAPNARRVAVGYPHIFNGTDCNALTWFSPAEQTRINALTDTMDTTVRSVSSRHGLGWADPRPTFDGHAVCDSVEFLNGLSTPIEESYHPNDAGNRAYAALVGGAMGLPTAVVDPVVTGSSGSSRTMTTSSTTRTDVYADLLPDLASETNLRRAEEAGLNRGQIMKLDRDLRSGDLHRARAAVVTLKQLDAQSSRS